MRKPRAIVSPARVAAVRAAGEAVRLDIDRNHCGDPCSLPPCRCADQVARIALAAYARAMGRDIEARQLEAMRDV